MDVKRLMVGVSALVLLIGFLLFGFTAGGVFNKIVPTSWKYPNSPLSGTVHHLEGAYMDLARPGPATGLILIGVGAVGLIYVYASKSRDGVR
jgi:hypothetical protein